MDSVNNLHDDLNQGLKAIIKNNQQDEIEIPQSITKKVEKLLDCREEVLNGHRTNALIFAKLIALVSLPTKRTIKDSRSKTLRLGKELWGKVTLMAMSETEKRELPFGADRRILLAIMHLAIINQSPVVYFDHACDLLKVFETSQDGRQYRRLREGFERIKDLAVRFSFGKTREEAEAGKNKIGESMFVIHRYSLPTKQDMKLEKVGQQQLTGISDDSRLDHRPYGVKLSEEFWKYLSNSQNHLLAPLSLLRMFVNQPIGWDYALFLIARCGAARTCSVIDHDTLIALFKEGKESDRKTIYRLKKYHNEIMLATENRLKVEIVEGNSIPSKGRPQKTWKLVIYPMTEKIIHSGKKIDLLDVIGDSCTPQSYPQSPCE